MTTRIEWASAFMTSIGVVPAGTEIGDDTVDGELALVINADSVFVIEGDRDELINLLQTALTNVKEHQ
jgi:hypothetical protein